MHDQPIQLDASFDKTPVFTVSSWLRTIDERVVSGEPIAIITDGESQYTVSAPCSGRIVEIYTETGARIIPRTTLGMVRPDLIVPEPQKGFGSLIAGVIMIVVAIIVIPLLATPQTNTLDPASNLSTPLPSDDIYTELPMPDAPLPGTAPDADNQSALVPDDTNQAAEDILPTTDLPAQDSSVSEEPVSEEPTPEITYPETPATDTNQDPSSDNQSNDTTTSNPALDASPTGFMSNDDISWDFKIGVDRIIALTEEVERNLPNGVMTQKEYDSVVANIAIEISDIVDKLNVVIANNNDNPNLNAENRRWFMSFNDVKNDCLSIYANIRQSVTAKQQIPNLQNNFSRCYTLVENFATP